MHRQLFDKSLADISEKLIIAIHCDLEALEAREKARGDRKPGSAKSQFAAIHQHLDYDHAVNTRTHSPTEIANSIFQKVQEKNSGVRLD